MKTHELMLKTNHFLIIGGTLTEKQKANITGQFLSAVSDNQTAQRFCNAVKFPNNIDSSGRQMYPQFFIPPYNNGKKLQTVIPLSPKTHILSANSYELEILRLLFLLSPENALVKDMVEKTLKRLKTTCFGYQNCSVGECFHSALIVLRFISTVTNDTDWIKRLIDFFKINMDNKLKLRSKGVHGNVLWYYWLCLSEMPLDLAKPEILRYKDRILSAISRSYVMNSDANRINHPVMISMLRNCLCRLEEFEYIKDRVPYIKSPENGRLGEKDGRLHFDMQKESINVF